MTKLGRRQVAKLAINGYRPVDWALSVFAASACWGLWVSNDWLAAGFKFLSVSGGLALYLLLSRIPSHVRVGRWSVSVFWAVNAFAPAIIAVYFLVTNDWSRPLDKTDWLEPIRQWLAARQTETPLPRMHANIAGGVLATWLPLQVAAVAHAYAHDERLAVRTIPALIATALSSVALLLSSLRGAWLALVVAAVIWLLARWSSRFVGAARATVAGFWCAGVVLLLGAVLGTSAGARLVAIRPDRLEVWRNSWALVHDYWLTGLGLGNFTMAYSSYALLVHVPHTAHAHNLAMDLWLDQGVVAPVAFAVAAIAALVARPVVRHGRWHDAAVVALLVVLTHGLFDDAFYGYGGAGALWLFVPLAWLVRTSEPWAIRTSQAVAVVGGLSIAAALAIAVVPRFRSGYEANLGTLAQTREELPNYTWPRWPVQDALRRSEHIDLAPARTHYRRALEIDSLQRIANQRLGQIALAFGDYDGARILLERAYQAAPALPAVRQLYGESLALTGNVTGAAALWGETSLLQNQLAIREQWYRSRGDAEHAQRIEEAVGLARSNHAP
jgi:hypothetical protein